MNCQNCDAPVLALDERCDKCGAELLHRRVFLGTAKTEDFALTADEAASEFEEPPAEEDPEPLFQAGWAQAPHAVVIDSAPPAQPRYGGFWRRLGAFVIDLAMIFLLCTGMAWMAYVADKGGLTRHHRGVSVVNAN